MQVMHSQSIRQAPTQPWALVTRDGGIITGNCDCKAGLGSTCTHVVALLFRVEAAVRIRETKGPATRNDIVDDIVDVSSSTMFFNVAKIASARASLTISLTKSLRVAGP